MNIHQDLAPAFPAAVEQTPGEGNARPEPGDIETLRAAQRRSANVRKSWIERKAKERDGNDLHCRCITPRSCADGFWVRLYGTVECGHCHRAIFDATGPVRS
jgi:hypothetical protein